MLPGFVALGAFPAAVANLEASRGPAGPARPGALRLRSPPRPARARPAGSRVSGDPARPGALRLQDASRSAAGDLEEPRDLEGPARPGALAQVARLPRSAAGDRARIAGHLSIGTGQSRGALRPGRIGPARRAQIAGLTPRAPDCGRRVERVLAAPRLDHRFEHVTLMQIEWGAPSPALGHPLVRETASAPVRETGRSPDSLRSAPASREGPCELEPLARPGAARLRGSPRSAPGRLEESRDPEPIRPDRAGPPAMGRPESRGVPRSGRVGPVRGTQIAGLPANGRGRSRGVPRSGALRAAVRSNSRCSQRRRPEIALAPEALAKSHAPPRSPRPPEPSKIELGLVYRVLEGRPNY